METYRAAQASSQRRAELSGTCPLASAPASGRFQARTPEELIAAAHAGCYSMALSAYLGSQKIESKRIETKAICTLEPIEGGFKIAKMHLTVTGTVPGIDNARFQELAREAERTCPVSNALRGSLEIELEANLA